MIVIMSNLYSVNNCFNFFNCNFRALKNAQAKLRSQQTANAQREQARKAEEVK